MRSHSYPNLFAAEKEKLIQDHKAEMAKLLEEHKVELEEKENKIYEARQFAQEANRKLKSAERDHVKVNKSLELTGAHVQEMEAAQESWREFLKKMDGQLSSKFGSFG